MKRKKTILVVDDNEDDLFVIEQLLIEDGYEVLTLNDSRLALDKISRHLPDLVIIDLSMPYVEGKQIINDLPDRFSYLPIIVISGNDQEYFDFVINMFNVNGVRKESGYQSLRDLVRNKLSQ